MTRRVVVVGGGIGGCSAALHLARGGDEVVLLEQSPNLGGLVVSFSIGGTPLECFYHHVFPHEREIQDLIAQVGLADRFGWYKSTVGVFTEGRIWPFTSPADLLRFRPLPLVDRVHTGLGALRLGRVADWDDLDGLPAREWLRRYCGDRATEVVWEPLLRAKFGAAAGTVPAAWMWGRFQQRSGGRQRGGERLGYLRGGFRQLFDHLAVELERLGVDVRTGSGARGIDIEGGKARGVAYDGGAVEADAVLFTGALPALSPLVADEHRDPRWSAIGGLGAMCVIVEHDRPFSDIYWTNVCDREVPFGGLIEHTNFVPSSDYGGRHLTYLGRYFVPSEPLATADLQAEATRWVDALVDRFDSASRASILGVHPFRTPYAAPLVQVGYRAGIPPLLSHIEGLYVSTTAQIYPQDRGMSEGVRTGIQAAGAIRAGTPAPAAA